MDKPTIENFLDKGNLPRDFDFGDHELGARIKEVRKYWGFSQEEFGQPLGVSRISIYNIEAGRAKPSTTFIKCLHFIYYADLEYLAYGQHYNHEQAVLVNFDWDRDFEHEYKKLNDTQQGILYAVAQLIASSRDL